MVGKAFLPKRARVCKCQRCGIACPVRPNALTEHTRRGDGHVLVERHAGWFLRLRHSIVQVAPGSSARYPLVLPFAGANWSALPPGHNKTHEHVVSARSNGTEGKTLPSADLSFVWMRLRLSIELDCPGQSVRSTSRGCRYTKSLWPPLVGSVWLPLTRSV